MVITGGFQNGGFELESLLARAQNADGVDETLLKKGLARYFPNARDVEQKIARPRQIYTGEPLSQWVPQGERPAVPPTRFRRGRGLRLRG